MYNRKNWHDLSKDKVISLQETNAESEQNIFRKKDQRANSDATQVHYIFPKSKFPQFAHYEKN